MKVSIEFIYSDKPKSSVDSIPPDSMPVGVRPVGPGSVIRRERWCRRVPAIKCFQEDVVDLVAFRSSSARCSSIRHLATKNQGLCQHIVLPVSKALTLHSQSFSAQYPRFSFRLP